MAIYFYTTRGEYGCFSNFARYAIEMDGRSWPTSEHYFQAMKFTDPTYQDRIAQARTPKEAAELGRSRSIPIRPDWDEYRDEVMRHVVLKKFLTHRDICEILLATGDEELVEKTSSDYYWGCGTEGTGKNMLGRILMEVREELRKQIKEAHAGETGDD